MHPNAITNLCFVTQVSSEKQNTGRQFMLEQQHLTPNLLIVFSVLLTVIPVFILSASRHFPQTITGHDYPNFVKIVEVGPRDGLQNEKVYTVISVMNPMYMHPYFVLLYMIIPGNSNCFCIFHT